MKGWFCEVNHDKLIEEKGFYAELYKNMGELTLNAVNFLKNQDYENFYKELENYQLLMEKLGVCDPIQKQQILEARKFGAKGVKISGSGLGDCIIAFSKQLPTNHFSVRI